MSEMITLGKPVRLGNGKMLPFRPAAVSPYGQTLSPSLGQTTQQNFFDYPLISLVFDVGGAAAGVVAGIKLSGAWSTIGWVVAVASILRAFNDMSKLQPKVSA